MPKAPTHFIEPSAYSEIILPLLLYADTGPRAGLGGMWTAAQQQIIIAPRLEHRIFWPALAAISVILVVRNWSRLILPPHIICLFVDTRLDRGYIGLTLLIIFIFATLHAIGRVRETARAWLLLALALFLILTNFLESGWMHAYDMLWLMFLIVAAEAGRLWQPSFRGAPEPIRRGPLLAARCPSLAPAQVSSKLGRF